MDRGRWLPGIGLFLFAATLGSLAVLHDPDAAYGPQAIAPLEIDSTPSADTAQGTGELPNAWQPPQLTPPLWLGASEGRHEVELFIDLTCAKCLKLSQTLEQIAQAHPGSMRIRLRLFPLDKDCNPTVEQTRPEHKDSCRITSLALAVGAFRPQSFSEFHRLATADGPANLIRAESVARTLLGPMAESLAAQDTVHRRLDEDLNRGIDFGIDVLPTLIISGKKYEGLPENDDTLQRILKPLLSTPSD